jgi:hypothetical protein
LRSAPTHDTREVFFVLRDDYCFAQTRFFRDPRIIRRLFQADIDQPKHAVSPEVTGQVVATVINQEIGHGSPFVAEWSSSSRGSTRRRAETKNSEVST